MVLSDLNHAKRTCPLPPPEPLVRKIIDETVYGIFRYILFGFVKMKCIINLGSTYNDNRNIFYFKIKRCH